ncbi:MAG TPA: hypothetical protein ENJ18_00515 [Nannocystis exedens]|nr:hypothetical protein [Nannocystis exedens]
MSERKIALLGGPESGKSTYLGALFDALDEGKCGLEKRGEATDARPIEQLTEPLLEGNYPQRTQLGGRASIEQPLTYCVPEGKSTEFTLSVGDYDGEEVERIFRDRVGGWSAEWQARANSSALLLFLRPSSIIPLPLLRERAPMPPPAPLLAQPKPFGSEPSSVFGPGVAADEPPPRQEGDGGPLRIPTMLTLIELLQFIQRARGLFPGERPAAGQLRLALVLSAWDAIEEEWQEAGPKTYLHHHMPLLGDFMWSNFQVADVQIFGLSSTGGDLNDSAHKRRYMEESGGFVEYIDVTGEINRSNDLSLPLRWALFGDAAMSGDP